MKRLVDFNAFAKWYIGDDYSQRAYGRPVDDNIIRQFFMDDFGQDIAELIGTKVEMIIATEVELGNWIDDGEEPLWCYIVPGSELEVASTDLYQGA